jgi:hypothetical protein
MQTPGASRITRHTSRSVQGSDRSTDAGGVTLEHVRTANSQGTVVHDHHRHRHRHGQCASAHMASVLSAHAGLHGSMQTAGPGMHVRPEHRSMRPCTPRMPRPPPLPSIQTQIPTWAMQTGKSRRTAASRFPTCRHVPCAFHAGVCFGSCRDLDDRGTVPHAPADRPMHASACRIGSPSGSGLPACPSIRAGFSSGGRRADASRRCTGPCTPSKEGLTLGNAPSASSD